MSAFGQFWSRKSRLLSAILSTLPSFLPSFLGNPPPLGTNHRKVSKKTSHLPAMNPSGWTNQVGAHTDGCKPELGRKQRERDARFGRLAELPRAFAPRPQQKLGPHLGSVSGETDRTVHRRRLQMTDSVECRPNVSMSDRCFFLASRRFLSSFAPRPQKLQKMVRLKDMPS